MAIVLFFFLFNLKAKKKKKQKTKNTKPNNPQPVIKHSFCINFQSANLVCSRKTGSCYRNQLHSCCYV